MPETQKGRKGEVGDSRHCNRDQQAIAKAKAASLHRKLMQRSAFAGPNPPPRACTAACRDFPPTRSLPFSGLTGRSES